MGDTSSDPFTMAPSRSIPSASAGDDDLVRWWPEEGCRWEGELLALPEWSLSCTGAGLLGDSSPLDAGGRWDRSARLLADGTAGFFEVAGRSLLPQGESWWESASPSPLTSLALLRWCVGDLSCTVTGLVPTRGRGCGAKPPPSGVAVALGTTCVAVLGLGPGATAEFGGS